ncbi:hypothetical protein CQW32_17400 [Pseudomonas putida]|uniref:hypothetical protein n=1 Tax=Pseudomonas putida TaxID=303 RepID=UPI000C2A1C71|nr:hypothetical protein [Pseudomonas putida]PJX09031.1 hypothetical protein CQW32_17400 [Pseudomonas putida]
MTYEFKGDNKALVTSITALLALDAKGALVPHGIGEMARQLLEASSVRLAEQQHGKPVALPQRKDDPNPENYGPFDSQLNEDCMEVIGWNACLDEIAKLGPLYRHPVHGEPVAWINFPDEHNEIPFVTWRSPDEQRHHNALMGAFDTTRMCIIPLYTHADPAEVEALRGAYLRAGEREHELRKDLARLRTALKFYADRDHFSTDDGLNWDSCSGEPANILWHESEPWFIEDGAIARAALEGNRDDDIPDLTPGKGNKAERRATQLLAQLQADLTARDERIDTLVDDLEQAQYDKDAWKNDKESLWVQVFHGEGDDPFISAVSGAICIEQLTLIQEEIVTGAEDLLESGPGFYVLRCRHHEAHYDNVGMTEPAHWEIDFESYSRFPWADEAEAMVKEAQPDYPECPTHAPDKPCPGCGTPGYTATCDKCIPY